MMASLPVNYGAIDEMHRLVAASLTGRLSCEEKVYLKELVCRGVETRDLYLDVIFQSSILLTWAMHDGLTSERAEI